MHICINYFHLLNETMVIDLTE